MFRIGLLTRTVARQLIPKFVSTNYSVNSANFVLNNNIRRYSIKIQNISEEKSLIAAQDPDTFGTLSTNNQQADDELLDEGDIKEDEYLKNPPRKSQKLRTSEYAELIKEHLRGNRIREAIDILEVKMIQEDRVKPENYIYNLLIGGCARVGFSKKAFQLFTKMKQRGLKVTGGTYTSLFNACANAPWTNDALEKSNRLREIMIEKGYEPNASNYNAMIKAYGRCKDLKTAFLLVDEMIEKDLPIKIDTFNFLLQACVSDHDFGFRHALLVWHKIYQRKLSPDVYSFNLMLRCCRDTGLGDLETTEEVIQTILLGHNRNSNIKMLEATTNSSDNSSELVEARNVQTTPNLLSMRPHLGSMISLSEVKRPDDRLLLLGGFSGFLDVMHQFEVAPDIITYSQLLDVLPSTQAAEKKLLSTLRKANIKCDIDFFNTLIKKRSMRFDYESAKEVLTMIKTAKLYPDIVTYGVLALGCQTQEEARVLQQEMNEKGIKMNIQILGAMLKQGCSKKNFAYVLEILDLITELRLKPSEQLLKNIDYFQRSCVKLIKIKDQAANKKFRNEFNNFEQRIDNWKEDIGIKDLQLEEASKLLKNAPWEQFQTHQTEGFESEKNQKLRKQKKIKRYISRIKESDLLIE